MDAARRLPCESEVDEALNEQLIIPEDPRLSRRIRDIAQRGALGHAIILSGQGDLLRAARFVAAAMECTGAGAPCAKCPACSKVLRDIHPDVTVVTDPEHKNLSIDVIRSVRTDAYIMPNEGRRRIFIFPDCGILDPKTQNVLLKVLEEGPPQAAFIFCARNSAVLLQTIRSRSVEWKLAAPTEGGEVEEDARSLCRLVAEGRSAGVAAFCAELENSKISREQLQKLLSDSRDLFARALAVSYGAYCEDPIAGELARQMDRRHLSKAADVLQSFVRECGYNINVGHLTGALAVALSEG